MNKLNNEKQTILFLAANPKGTTPLRLEEEMRDIAEGLKRARNRDGFKLEHRLAVRTRDIQRAMLDLNPQIVHFSGHGAGEEGLVFEDEIGQAKLVNGAALASLFELFADQLECVVLNGCYSKVQAEAIAEHISYVIGMTKAISDTAAIEFAVGFYDALGAGRSVEFAYKLGCSAIRMVGLVENLIPVLLKKQNLDETITQSISSVESSLPLAPGLEVKKPAKSESQAIEVFFSYAHEDEILRDELAKHLKNMVRKGEIKAWYDREITAGSEWAGQIDEHLNAAQIILLLVSPDFINSDYCNDVELRRAMERHEKEEAIVIPVILRPADWKGTSFEKLQPLPKNARPVTKWSDRDEAFLNIVQGIRKVVDTLQPKK